MKKKIIGIFVSMLLILTVLPIAIPAVGTMNENITQRIESQLFGLTGTFPDDEFFDLQWALHNTGQTGGNADCDIDAPECWDIEKGDSNVVIAIVDSGIDNPHTELSGRIWTNVDEIADNGIDDDGNGYIDDIKGWNFFNDNNDTWDENGHGTLCAGIIGAVTDNDEGIAGVCWDCQIMPLKTCGNHCFLNLDNCIEAIYYAADNGADIILMGEWIDDFDESLWNAVDYASSKGVFMCAGAGDEGWSNEKYPAAFENVVAVAGTDEKDNQMSDEQVSGDVESNFGDWVDVAAPGQDIFSTMPSGDSWYSIYGGLASYYSALSGTAMAASHVAGLAALLLSKNPSLTPDDIKELICSEDNVDPYNSTYDLGSGRINAYKTLFDSPDLHSDDSLNWNDVTPGDTVHGNFTIENIGEIGSLLDWNIVKKPNWGDWTIDPMYGYDIELGVPFTINVTVIAPDEENTDYSGEIMIQNRDDSNDTCTIDVKLATPKSNSFNFLSNLYGWLERFPILQKILDVLGFNI